MNAITAIPLSPEVTTLLESSGLPTEDLQGGREVSLFGEYSAGKICGIVGLEIYDRNALLRSLAVSETERHSGIGSRLVAFAEQEASRRGATAIYLLTTTAARFFEHRGYRHVARREAPADIATTQQFSSLCPASSAFMVKVIHG